MKPRSPGLVVVVALAILIARPARSVAAPAIDVVSRPGQAGPYCGVYAVYAAARLEGCPVALRDLLVPDYISSVQGSTAGDLVAAAGRCGLHAVPVADLSPEALRDCRSPVLLHVRSGSDDGWQYDHWVLYAGVERGMAKVLNVPEPAQLIPFDDLSLPWDGVAVVVSKGPIDEAAVLAGHGGGLVAFGVAVTVGCLAYRLVTARRPAGRPSVARPAWQGLAVVALSGGVACVYHAAAADGFLRRPDLATSVAKGYVVTFLPKLTAAEAVRAHRGGRAVFVDARATADYAAGHIDGARTVPVFSSPGTAAARLADVPTAARVVVYCQDRRCPFAARVATTLVAAGYTDVELFPGGWVEWQAAAGSR